MSLLVKALKYRERYLKEHLVGSCLGLLKKVLLYINHKKNKNILETPQRKDEVINDKLEIKKAKSPDKKRNIKTLDKTTIYSDIIDHISNELSQQSDSSTLSYNSLIKTISSNFHFTKCALLTYSPLKDKFIFKSGINIDKETESKLSFDIKFNDIFKRMIKDNSYILYPDNLLYYNLKPLFSKKDFKDINFQVFIPFIFLGHVVGIFAGLKLSEKTNLDKEIISSLEKIGLLNGNLLYKLIQTNNE